MGGLTFEKLLLVAVLAVVLLGPDRLPRYAAQLARLVKSFKAFTDSAKDRMREEMGPEFDEVDWKKLDPRQYDPRRIIREALLEDGAAAAAVVTPVPRSVLRTPEEHGLPAPFDTEAT
jgi:sec-independent protein translocase protein TatB